MRTHVMQSSFLDGHAAVAARHDVFDKRFNDFMDFFGLKDKHALILGVSDNVGFAWHIAKALQTAGAKIILSTHPRVLSIVDRFLTKDKYKESRLLSNGKYFEPELVIPCDVGIDEGEDSIKNLHNTLAEKNIEIKTLVHSLAFSPEISKKHIDVSRSGYLTSMSISSYSLVALVKSLSPLFVKEGASVMALSYLASERAVPFYGGGMASAKAALECDARMLAWSLGEDNHRINIISPGPYASRAAKSIGDMEQMVEKVKELSPLRKAITAEDVAACALFLASDLSLSITGETIHIDAGFHAMAIA